LINTSSAVAPWEIPGFGCSKTEVKNISSRVCQQLANVFFVAFVVILFSRQYSMDFYGQLIFLLMTCQNIQIYFSKIIF